MLNISPNSVQRAVQLDEYECFQRSGLSSANRMFTRWLVALLIIILVMIFLPWPIKNAMESDRLDSRTILFGAPTGPQLDLRTLEMNYEKVRTN